MTYSSENVADFHRNLREQTANLQTLFVDFAQRQFRTPKGAEYAKHGFARRAMTLRRCLINLFRELPPEQSQVPSPEARKDAEINIQSFAFNLTGALDNLAWIWVKEAQVTKTNGGALPRKRIGLSDRCTEIRRSFSDDYRMKLDGFRDWFDHVADFRHALAHRIPLYIPPHCISPENIDEYNRLEREKLEAVRKFQFDRHKELEEQQSLLEHFKAFMAHSLEEGSPTVYFHPQILSDAATLNELARGLLGELDSLEP